MCTTHVYTYAYPDGRRRQSTRPALCGASRHGQPCVDNVVLKHPTQYLQYAPAAVYPAYAYPPTPPSPSTPVVYRSGDDSDRSSSSNRRARRPSSGVYVGGQRVVADQPRRPDSRRSSSRRERIVLVDNPPTPRTPPPIFSTPHTAPSSPNFRSSAVYTPERPPSSRRPVIVDERQRPFVQIEVADAPRARHPSTSSRGSSRRYSSAAEEADAEDRRRADREDEYRARRLRERIADANAEIERRPAVPMPASLGRRASGTAAGDGRARDREEELVDALRRLDVKEQRLELEHRRAREREREHDEAQRARLRERMVPHRRATVGPGSRRHRVLYDDGLYHWE